MRLINVNSKVLTEFYDDDRPSYAILSHTWGPNEVTFKDFQSSSGYQGGFEKIDGICQLAQKQGFTWVWIDTCCIDKSSSAELSEAINSMFEWYKRADVCYVYLEDVPPGEDIQQSNAESSFFRSRWFTRGWTLQELLAPRRLEFYNGSWGYIDQIVKKPPRRVIEPRSSKHYESPHSGLNWFPRLVSLKTKITFSVLTTEYDSISNKYSVAQKMSWAAGRKTTRKEDRAYSLLGLFGVNMPMLYGEGDRAFSRLQEEILKVDDDQSIFAWGYRLPGTSCGGLFAHSPDDFAGCREVIKVLLPKSPHYFLTNKGLHIETTLTESQPDLQMPFYAHIDCAGDYIDHPDDHLAIPLCRTRNEVYRPPYAVPMSLPPSKFRTRSNQLYVSTAEDPDQGRTTGWWPLKECFVMFDPDMKHGSLTAVELYPPYWNCIPLTSGDGIRLIPNLCGARGKMVSRRNTVFVRLRSNNANGGEAQPDIALRMDLRWHIMTASWSTRIADKSPSLVQRMRDAWIREDCRLNSTGLRVVTIPRDETLFAKVALADDDNDGGWLEKTEWAGVALRPTLLKSQAQFRIILAAGVFDHDKLDKLARWEDQLGLGPQYH